MIDLMPRQIFSIFLIVFLFLGGIIFRLLLAYFSPQSFILDQTEYHELAVKIKDSPFFIAAHPYRQYGFPIVLAMIYSIFGTENTIVWIYLQAVLDALVSLMIFYIGWRIFGNKLVAWLGFILYLFNPFTAAYVGVRLSEIYAIFFLTLLVTLYLLFIKLEEKRSLFLLALFAGFLPQVRPGFLYFSLSIIFIAFLIMRKKRTNKKFFIYFFGGLLFIIPFLYSLIANFKVYRKISLVTIDNLAVKEFYASLYTDDLLKTTAYPPELNNMYFEYGNKWRDVTKYDLDTKYLKLSMEKVKNDPGEFLLSRLRKMKYIWEKYQIFPYYTLENKLLLSFIYWSNLIIIFLCGFGLYKSKKEVDYRFYFLCMYLLIYTTFIHLFSVGAERYTLPVYPIVFLFAGYGICQIVKTIIKFKYFV